MSRRVAIVTGAGNGLGAAFAEAVAAKGAAVVVNNRRHTNRPFSAQATADAIIAAGGQAITDDHAVDASDGPARIIATATDAWGRLDALILNAGISGPAVKVGAGDTDLKQVMAINFFANVALIEAALPALLASPAGRIVFVSSTGGLHGVRGRSAYAASKGAVNGYALSLAEELKRTNIRVNLIAPYAATNMTARPDRPPDPRMAPSGAAAMCAYLASERCDRTGEIWVAGSGHIRAARAMESATAPFDPKYSDGAALDRLAAMPEPRFYPGGEVAFADFYRSVFGE